MSNSDDFNDRSQLESELDKEKTLRNNLQKSYNSLLQRLKLDSAFFEEGEQDEDGHKQFLTPSSRVIAKYEQQTGGDDGKGQMREAVALNQLRRSCC